MNQSDCTKFLEQPDAYPDHLEECERCHDKAGQLEKLDDQLRSASSIELGESVADGLMEHLPVASWEGASHRAWVLVLGGAGVMVLLVAIAFSFLGVSPVEGFWSAVSQTTVPRKSLIDVSESLVALIQRAPARFHLLIAVSFVVVNAVFFFLLRRSPRGYDASSR